MNTAIKTTITSLLMAYIFALPHQVIGQSIAYEYDDLNRLISVSYSDSLTIEYAYDELGNRVGYIVDNTPNSVSEEIGLADVKVFPNPASESLSVVVSLFGEATPLSMKVYDSTGKPVYEQSAKSPSDLWQQEINTSIFPAGAYILELETEKGAISQRFIIQR